MIHRNFPSGQPFSQKMAEKESDGSFERLAIIKNIREPHGKLDMYFYPTKLECNTIYPIHLPF